MIVKAELSHFIHVTSRMRKIDLMAMRAAYGNLSAEQFAHARFQPDGVAFAFMKDGLPIAICGMDDSSGEAIIWLIATTEWKSSLREVFRTGLRLAEACFSSGYKAVKAYVVDGFTPGYRFLEGMGFQKDGVVRNVGMNGEDFVVFSKGAP